VALIATLAGCARSPHLADGPIDLSPNPTTVRFVQPVTSYGQAWELCFEFDLPGDSQRAAAIHARLVSSSGDRVEIRMPALDRRGESTVCQIGQLAVRQPTPAGVVYEAVELYSDVPVRLRGIRGGSRP
jgi:hypothetical protein